VPLRERGAGVGAVRVERGGAVRGRGARGGRGGRGGGAGRRGPAVQPQRRGVRVRAGGVGGRRGAGGGPGGGRDCRDGGGAVAGVRGADRVPVRDGGAGGRAVGVGGRGAVHCPGLIIWGHCCWSYCRWQRLFYRRTNFYISAFAISGRYAPFCCIHRWRYPSDGYRRLLRIFPLLRFGHAYCAGIVCHK